MLSGGIPSLSGPVPGLQLSKLEHLHNIIHEEKWVRLLKVGRTNIHGHHVCQTQPRPDLRRLYICDSRQERQPGVQSPSSL